MDKKHMTINFTRVYINAALIWLFDAYVLNQGAIAAITIVSGGILLPFALYKQFRFGGYGPHIKKYLIYVVAALLVFFSNYVNNKFGQSQANYLVEKIERYKQDNGVYPPSLEAMVPKYVSRVPVAKFSMMGDFHYHLFENDKPMLFYVVFPPFYRNGYNFERKEWHTFD